VTATDIVVRNNEGSELFGPEIILAASDKVAIEAGSRVSAKGPSARSSGTLSREAAGWPRSTPTPTATWTTTPTA
jgi:hypothetical protein